MKILLNFLFDLRDTPAQTMVKSGGMPENIQNARLPQSEQKVPESGQEDNALRSSLKAMVLF